MARVWIEEEIPVYHLIKKYGIICKSKKKGGLGVKDIRKLNICLLCKWWWNLENETGLWQEIVKANYTKGVPIGARKKKLTDSPVWSDLLKVRQFYLKGGGVETKNGKNSLFLDRQLAERQTSVHDCPNTF